MHILPQHLVRASAGCLPQRVTMPGRIERFHGDVRPRHHDSSGRPRRLAKHRRTNGINSAFVIASDSIPALAIWAKKPGRPARSNTQAAGDDLSAACFAWHCKKRGCQPHLHASVKTTGGIASLLQKSSCQTSHAKPPAPPRQINSLRIRWGRHSACRVIAPFCTCARRCATRQVIIMRNR